MPCIDGGQIWPTHTNEAALKKSEENPNKVGALLCSACRSLESFGFDFDTNPELSRWWNSHKKKDEKERLAKLALDFELRVVEDALGKRFNELTKSEFKLLKKHGHL